MAPNQLTLNLFWRTFFLIALLLVSGVVAWTQTFRALEFEPRAALAAQQMASLVKLTQNTFRGPFVVAVNAYSPTEGGSYEEEQNTIFGNGVFVWNGTELPYAAYRATTGLGDRDHIYASSA